jgi:hypothetical protein
LNWAIMSSRKARSATITKPPIVYPTTALRLNIAFRALFVLCRLERWNGEKEATSLSFHFVRACCAMFYKWWIVRSFRFCVGSHDGKSNSLILSLEKHGNRLLMCIKTPTAINLKALFCRSAFDLTQRDMKASFQAIIWPFAC